MPRLPSPLSSKREFERVDWKSLLSNYRRPDRLDSDNQFRYPEARHQERRDPYIKIWSYTAQSEGVAFRSSESLSAYFFNRPRPRNSSSHANMLPPTTRGYGHRAFILTTSH